jgi:Leucine-rich repeat (LRR) protein
MRLLFLRNRMLATAFLILGLGTSFAQYEKAIPQQSEREAAAALSRIGVPLQRDTRGVVRWIEAVSSEINDEAMQYLPALPGLEWLEIGGGNVTSSGIANLKSCTALRRLYIHDVNLNGDSLEWLANLKNLEALSLQHAKITGSVVKNIKSTNLAVLNLSGNKIANEDMDAIAQLKGLEVLALADTQVSGEGIAKLEGMPRLNELNLMNCNINDADLGHFLTTPNLRIVYAAGCNVTDMGIQSIVSRFPMLAIFH